MRRLSVAAVLAVLAGLLVAAAPAGSAAARCVPGALGQRPGEPAHSQPGAPARASYPKDFPRLYDAEWCFRLGGFGGVRRGAKLRHVPVIFVHGNNVDASNWYPVRDDFRAAGWSDQELWALSYNGMESAVAGSALTRPNRQEVDEHVADGWTGSGLVTANDVNVPDLYAFIRAVQAYTGTPYFSLVTHSLGVTVARKTLKVHPELRRYLVAFVGIAGGNHGTSFCPPGSEGNVVSCNEVAAGTAWLAALNGRDGADETFGSYRTHRFLTVYDGSGAGDPAYAGPSYAQSPVLKGATNLAFPGTYHNDLRLDPTIVAVYRLFVESAERYVRR